MFDSDKAAAAARSCWVKLGRAYAKASLEAAERGFASMAMDCAARAEACFWQATGDGDALSVSDFVKSDKPQDRAA